MVACGEVQTSEPTPSLRPTRTLPGTPTPNAEVLAERRVVEVFTRQISAIQQGNWQAVYETCSPSFRSARNLDRFVLDSTRQFASDGYSSTGFEARNIDPVVRSFDRVRVSWDAYQDGAFVRNVEIGQTYIFTQGEWFDDGAWCR
jgi:hypothetical protein